MVRRAEQEGLGTVALFAAFRALAIFALVAIAGSVLYAAALAIRYWPGIGV